MENEPIEGNKTGKSSKKSIIIAVVAIIVIAAVVWLIFGRTRVLTAEEYKNEVKDIAEEVSESILYVGDFVQEMPDSSKWSDEDRAEIDTQMNTIENAHKKAKSLKAPAEYKEANKLFVKGMEKYAEAMPILLEAIENQNEEKLKEWEQILAEGTDYLSQSGEKMKELE